MYNRTHLTNAISVIRHFHNTFIYKYINEHILRETLCLSNVLKYVTVVLEKDYEKVIRKSHNSDKPHKHRRWVNVLHFLVSLYKRKVFGMQSIY